MKVIGVTGSLGTGKTTVAKIFKGLGAQILDADKIAHKVIASKGSAHKKVLKIFGRGILRPSKEIDRRLLGEIIFSNECARLPAGRESGGRGFASCGKNRRPLDQLCRIIHPLVIKHIRKELAKLKRKNSEAIVILDAPLLIEAGLAKIVDKLIVVRARRSLQVARCQKKTGLKRQKVTARIKAQMPISEKIRYADFVIDNSGTRDNTKRKVKRIWEQIQQQTMPPKAI